MKKLFFLFSLLPFFASAQQATTVHRFYDGDTWGLKIKADTSVRTVRLVAINTPEQNNIYCSKEQPFAREITDSVRTILKGKEVVYTEYGTDIYNRKLVSIQFEGQDFIAYMLYRGWGWYQPNKRKSLFKKNVLPVGLRTIYRNAESDAKKNKRGIWSDGDVIDPSEWLKMYRQF